MPAPFACQTGTRKRKRGARTALKLTDTPNTFLSTIQIGITLVAILAGAFGGATLADELSDQIEAVELLRPYADQIALYWRGCLHHLSVAHRWRAGAKAHSAVQS